MHKSRYSPWIFLLTLCLAGAHMLWMREYMPENVAAHFDATGAADGWCDRDMFTARHAGLIAGIALVFALMRVMLDRMPVNLINVPHKHFWFAPERRADSARAIWNWTLWLGTGFVAFLTAVMHQAVLANLRPAHRLPETIWWLTGAFLLLTGLWLLAFYRALHTLPTASPPERT